MFDFSLPAEFRHIVYIKNKKKEEKCGITYYFGAAPLACCDMDINPGLTTVQI